MHAIIFMGFRRTPLECIFIFVFNALDDLYLISVHCQDVGEHYSVSLFVCAATALRTCSRAVGYWCAWTGFVLEATRRCWCSCPRGARKCRAVTLRSPIRTSWPSSSSRRCSSSPPLGRAMPAAGASCPTMTGTKDNNYEP